MPLSPRELILLQIRAQDAASGPLQQVGAAAGKLNSIISGGSLRMFAYSQGWARLGQSMTRAGLAITALNVLAFKAAADFGHEMALMQTQAQLTQDQFVRISKDALRVSSTYGVAATDIGRALYDIFSTTRSNSKEAIEMVSGLARASVAGAVDIREATRGVIDIQNAFGEQAGSTTDILNLQFQMLRNSAGTYQELVNAFGSVIGAARQTDQSIQSVSGAIAFLTLRGRSQAEAAISVSRALDLLGRHAKDVRMVLDVNLFDAAGNFRALEDIITDMGTAMQGMTSRERVNAFTEIFGAGSIQANRFFRLAVPQFEALNRSVDELSKKEIAGQLNKAFRAMVRNDPTFILNRIKEQFRNIGITIMTTLAPALKFLADKIQIVFDWFSQLSPKVQKWIGVGAILAGIFLLIGGGVFSLISAVTGLISIFKLAGVSLLGFYAISMSVLAVIALIAGAAYLIYKNWETVKPFFENLWADVQAAFQSAVDWLNSIDWAAVWAVIQTTAKAVFDWFVKYVVPIVQEVVGFISEQWDKLVAWWHQYGPEIKEAVGNVVDFIVVIWKKFGPIIVSVVTAAWNFVKGIIDVAMKVIRGIILVITGIINADWKTFWDGIKMIAGGIWDAIKNIVKFALRAIGDIIRGAWALITGALHWLWNRAKDITITIWNNIVDWVKGIPGKLAAALLRGVGLLVQAGRALIQGAWEGAKSVAVSWITWAGDLTSIIARVKGPLDKDLRLLRPHGRAIMEGFGKGMSEGWSKIEPWLKSRSLNMQGLPPRNLITPQTQRSREGIVVNLYGGDEQTARKVARELDWLMRTSKWS